MKKTGLYIAENLLQDSEQRAKVQQVGVDLTVSRIFRIKGAAKISDETTMGTYEEVYPGEGSYMLTPGPYAVEFDQGLLALPPNQHAFIMQRSSLNRNGVLVQGSVYDPGFYCDKLGASMYVFAPIVIEQHARIAQLLVEENDPVDEDYTYNGQFQGKRGN